MNIKKILGMTFRSGPFAMTDIHNGGSIIGIIYHEVLTFSANGVVSLHKVIELDRSGGIGWKESLEQERWIGVYEFDRDGKHVKCTLDRERTQQRKVIYADLVGTNCLIAEVHWEEEGMGSGQVFTRIP